MSSTRSPFEALRTTDLRDRTPGTPSPLASPSGFTASSAWSDDGADWEAVKDSVEGQPSEPAADVPDKHGERSCDVERG